MRAMAIDEFGGPDRLYERELGVPPTGPNDVLVRIAYAGVNPGDARIRRGSFATKGRHFFPVVLGWEGAGVVEKIGVSGSHFRVGDSVYGFFRHDYIGDGTYAEFAPARTRHLRLVPADVDVREAAALPIAGGTALVLVEELLRTGPGDRVLVLGAAGGVGHLAVQIAVANGAEVIGVARAENHQFVRDLGAHHVLDHRDGHLPEAVRRIAPSGVDAAVDTVGGEAQEGLSALLRPGGAVASCVHAAESPVFAERNQTVKFEFLHATAARLARLEELLLCNKVRPRIVREHPLSDAALAHADLDAGHGRGKFVLRVR